MVPKTKLTFDRCVPDVGLGLRRLLVDIARQQRGRSHCMHGCPEVIHRAQTERGNLLQRRVTTVEDKVRGAFARLM